MKILKHYLESFFTIEEQQQVQITCNTKYKDSEISDWLEAEYNFKSLLPYCNNLNSFYIRMADSCSFFIYKLFKKYTDENTFVIGVCEHPVIQENLKSVKNGLILHYDTVKYLDIESILNRFKESGCKKIFLYITGILETHILPFTFCTKLKDTLVKQEIEHFMVLDDVQSMFLIPKDYSIFDCVLFTCHSLLPNFDTGILLSKTQEEFGYCDAVILNKYLASLKIILTKLDKLNLFNILLQQYYAEELVYENLFDIPKSCSQTNFYIQIKNNIHNKLINKYKKDLETYYIILAENTITIKGINFILQDPTKAMEGLAVLKNVLQKCIKLNIE